MADSTPNAAGTAPPPQAAPEAAPAQAPTDATNPPLSALVLAQRDMQGRILGDLRREFTGRREHKRSDLTFVRRVGFAEPLQRWHEKGNRLSGACSGLGTHVLAAEQWRKRGLLHRCWSLEAHAFERLLQLLIDGKVGECACG